MLSEDEQLALAIASSMNDGDESPSEVKAQPEIATVDLTDPKESTMI